ncbi:MAG: hypothetical protein J0626_07035, partial [Rhodospirillaceae bacterium]|nr:hypothetical protein [Rhodospirillaceae bacterium]
DYVITALARARVRKILSDRLGPTAERYLRYVVPLFNFERGSKPLVAGCAVKLAIESHRFLLTAGHVIDELSRVPLYVMADSGGWIQLTGESTSTYPLPPNTRDEDRIDAGVLRLDEVSAPQVHGPYLGLKNLEIDESQAPSRYCLIAGYPSSRLKKNFEEKKVTPRALRYAATQVFDYHTVDPEIQRYSHVVLDFERDGVVGEDGLVMTAPAPDGMSGCGVWAWRSLLRP